MTDDPKTDDATQAEEAEEMKKVQKEAAEERKTKAATSRNKNPGGRAARRTSCRLRPHLLCAHLTNTPIGSAIVVSA